MAKAAELRNAANTNIYGAAKSTGGLISSALSGGNDTAGTAQKAASGMVGGGLAGAVGGVMGKTVNDLAKDVAAEDAAKVMPTDNGQIPFMGSTNPGEAAYNPDGQPIFGYDYAMGNNFGKKKMQAPQVGQYIYGR